MLLPGRAPAGRRQDLQPAPDRRRGGLEPRPPAALPPGARARRPRPRRARCSARPTSRARRTRPAIAEAGFSTEDTLEVTRVLGRGMARYAEALRDAVRRRRSSSRATRELELARRLREPRPRSCCRSSGRGSTTSSSCTCSSCCATTSSGSPSARLGQGLRRARETAVAFADLVGFTELGETVDVEELGGLAGRLSQAGERGRRAARARRQADRRRGDARLARRRGGSSSTLPRADRARRGRGDFPPLRAGVAYGPAVNRWGDWFGSTVNVASRLTGRARPGAVLVSDAVKERVGDDAFAWSDGGREEAQGPQQAAQDLPAAG